MKKLLLSALMLMLSAAVFGSGRGEDLSAGQERLSGGIESYSNGDLDAALQEFRQAAASEDPKISAAGYYNQGTIEAELAEQLNEPAKKREALEAAYDSLRRAAEIGSLGSEQTRNVRRNMEVVRRRLSKLPPPQNQQQNRQQESQQSQQSHQEQQPQQGGGQSEDAQSGGKKSSHEQPSNEHMLRQQQDLRNRTEKGQGSDEQLAAEQKQLQKQSEAADMNEAAINQAKAAEVLKEGDRKKAVEYQKAAEQALQAQAESSGAEAEADAEAEDILNQEAERQRQDRMDSSGGIREADRNW